MRREKVQPKLAQQQIIDLMIESAARDLSGSYHQQSFTEYIPAKNAATIEKMIKSGILDSDWRGTFFSAGSLAKYASIIRQIAQCMIEQEIMKVQGYRASAVRERAHWWNYRVNGVNKHIVRDDRDERIWFIGTEPHGGFSWIAYTADHVDGAKRYFNIVSPITALNNLESYEEKLQECEHCSAYAELASLPIVRIVAY